MILFLLGAILYILHQDFWLWKEARPLVFGFLPVGLAYHGAYTLFVAGFMALLCKFAWPAHLEGEEDRAD